MGLGFLIEFRFFCFLRQDDDTYDFHDLVGLVNFMHNYPLANECHVGGESRNVHRLPKGFGKEVPVAN